MQDRNISLTSLLSATFRLLPQFMALVGLIGLACVALYVWVGDSKLLWLIVVAFYALLFFSAPIASSSVRARRRLALMSRAGAKTFAFSFVWGGTFAALFVATLHVGQGMETTVTDYFATIAVGGLFCACVACIPGER
jgi:hypothetical protein